MNKLNKLNKFNKVNEEYSINKAITIVPAMSRLHQGSYRRGKESSIESMCMRMKLKLVILVLTAAVLGANVVDNVKEVS